MAEKEEERRFHGERVEEYHRGRIAWTVYSPCSLSILTLILARVFFYKTGIMMNRAPSVCLQSKQLRVDEDDNVDGDQIGCYTWV